jgi:(p)ppGpp synthase/HD superfamily hydrolase
MQIPTISQELPLLSRAYLLAEALHRLQKRTANIIEDTPYLSHPMQVSGLVMVAGGDEETAAAGLLHDILGVTR